MRVLWKTLDSEKTGLEMKQHGYIEKISAGGNKRNISLCGKYSQIGDDEKPELFENMYGEILHEPTMCKNCQRAYDKLLRE